jgi:hypothetical protein
MSCYVARVAFKLSISKQTIRWAKSPECTIRADRKLPGNHSTSYSNNQGSHNVSCVHLCNEAHVCVACVCMYICVHVCMYVCLNVYICAFLYICLCISECVYIYIYVCICVCVCVYVNAISGYSDCLWAARLKDRSSIPGKLIHSPARFCCPPGLTSSGLPDIFSGVKSAKA